jgi:hypothetical protein
MPSYFRGCREFQSLFKLFKDKHQQNSKHTKKKQMTENRELPFEAISYSIQGPNSSRITNIHIGICIPI